MNNRTMKNPARLLLFAATLAAASALPARAAQVDKSVPFQLDGWIALDSTDGPLTLHRVRLAHASEGIKSKFMRPNNTEYVQDVQIQLEFTNAASHDWKARLDIAWLDADGKVIDGYLDTENLDDGSHHDLQTVTLSTLKYGIAHARTLRVRIEYFPE